VPLIYLSIALCLSESLFRLSLEEKKRRQKVSSKAKVRNDPGESCLPAWSFHDLCSVGDGDIPCLGRAEVGRRDDGQVCL
jgi:hypothetical protein